VGVAAIGGAMLLVGCSHKPPPAPPPAIVLAAPVHPETGDGEGLRYPVEAAARYTTTMSFRVAGKLIERRVRLGDLVRKGQVVARLDAMDAQRQAASARASLDAAEHRLIYARQQLDRDRAQAAQNLIAANQLEQTEDAYAAAAAAREQAAAQNTVAHNALEYNTLIADHDGYITSENADTGQVVTAGQAVYGLAWSGDVDVDMDTAAGDLGRVKVGQPASVSFTALPGRRFDARVREISPAADAQSRTYRVKLTLLTPTEAVHFGMTGDAVLAPAAADAAHAPVFRVPATALFHQGKDPAVWVVQGNESILELRRVAVSSYAEREVTISDGLKDGEQIVLAGVHTVFAGEKVTPQAPLFARDAQISATEHAQ
jgi:RND family efflux transporter MFP subunit